MFQKMSCNAVLLDVFIGKKNLEECKVSMQ